MPFHDAETIAMGAEGSRFDLGAKFRKPAHTTTVQLYSVYLYNN